MQRLADGILAQLNPGGSPQMLDQQRDRPLGRLIPAWLWGAPQAAAEYLLDRLGDVSRASGPWAIFEAGRRGCLLILPESALHTGAADAQGLGDGDPASSRVHFQQRQNPSVLMDILGLLQRALKLTPLLAR